MDKPAAGISVGHNSAGVNFLSDCRDGSSMGEGIAIGILEGQALWDPNDEFVFSTRKFDG